jgi:glycosyltransferase involved in cell wall biosynthesis
MEMFLLIYDKHSFPRRGDKKVSSTGKVSFDFLANFLEKKSRGVGFYDSSNAVEIYLIKEGAGRDTGGIGVWFHSLSRSSSLKGKTCFIYSCGGVTRLDANQDSLEGQHLKVDYKLRLSVRVLRNQFVRKLFARFGFDAEEVLNFLFVYFFIHFIGKLTKQNVGFGRIITPIYEGYGAYLPASWPIWIGLVSSTKHSIQNLSISPSRFRRHYLPKIQKEEILLAKFKSRIAISESIIGEFKGKRDDENFEVLPPKIIDPKSTQFTGDNSVWSSIVHRKKIVLFIGRMEPRKGFDILLDAWKLSQLSKKGYELHMCGELGQNLPTEFRNVEGVHFKGKITELEKQDYLSSSRLVVVPSRFESFGIVTLEAMGNHTPVLVSDVAGLRYVSSIANSVQIFSESNALDCASKMLRILESEADWDILSRRVRADFEDLFLLS